MDNRFDRIAFRSRLNGSPISKAQEEKREMRLAQHVLWKSLCRCFQNSRPIIRCLYISYNACCLCCLFSHSSLTPSRLQCKRMTSPNIRYAQRPRKLTHRSTNPALQDEPDCLGWQCWYNLSACHTGLVTNWPGVRRCMGG